MSERVVARDHICITDVPALRVPAMLTRAVELIRDQVADVSGQNPQFSEDHFLRITWEVVELEKEPA